MPRTALPLLTLALLAGCSTARRPVAVAVAPPPPVAIETAPLPAGASPGMLVPAPLADGSFPTPNQRLSEAGTVWHLRAALNVAALSCPGEAGAAIRAGYNAWLTRARLPLAAAQRRYAAEYRAAGYDDAMTRLYNFFAQTPVRTAFCAAAAGTVADMAAADAAPAAALAGLDRPFTDFYRAYDAWRRAAPVAVPAQVIAAVAVAAPAPHPALVLDLAALPVDAAVAGGR